MIVIGMTDLLMIGKAVDESGHERAIEQTGEMHVELEVPTRRREEVKKHLGLFQIEAAIVRIGQIADYLS